MTNFTNVYKEEFASKQAMAKELHNRREIINELYSNISLAKAFIESFKNEENMNIDDRLILLNILKGK